MYAAIASVSNLLIISRDSLLRLNLNSIIKTNKFILPSEIFVFVVALQLVEV